MKKFNIFLLGLLIILATFIGIEWNRKNKQFSSENQLVISTTENSDQLNKKNNNQKESAQSGSKLARPSKNDVHADHEHDEETSQTPIDDTMLAKERIYTENEIEHMSRAEFQHTLLDIKRKLPVVSELKKIPEAALHHTPSIVLKAGRDISVVAEVAARHPEYEIDALNFYDTCARNPQGVTTVRALCLTNIIEINNKNKQTTDLSIYPKEIVDLSRMVIED